MKIYQIIKETTAGASASGSVASVAMPMGEVQKRVDVKKPKKKSKYMNSLSEGAVKQLAMDLKELSDSEFKKKYGKNKKEMQGTKEVKEADLHEDDIIVVPGQGMKRRTGFVPQGQSRVDHEVEMARSDVLATMKNAKAIYELLRNRSEDDGIEGWVQEKLIKANDYLNAVKEYYDEKYYQQEGLGGAALGGVTGAAITKSPRGAMLGADIGSKVQDFIGDKTNESGGVIAGGGVGESAEGGSNGYENAKAIVHAAKNRTTAEINLGGEPITLEQNEVDYVNGVYKQAVKDGRVEDIVRVLGDPVKFDKLMKKIRDMLYRDRSKEMAQATADRLAVGLNEKAVSKAQQKFMGMVHAVQKGEMKAPSKAVAKAAKGMSQKAGHDFAATKHKGLPEKVKKDKE